MVKEKWSNEASDGKINGLFDKGCNFEGKLTFNGVMQVNGKFDGEVNSDGTLIVGPDALLKGSIKVDTVIIDGCVEGELEAKTKIELRSSGRLMADISTKSFVIEEGGIFHGASKAIGLSTSDGMHSNGGAHEPVYVNTVSDEQDEGQALSN